MSIVVLNLPDIKANVEDRPRQCPSRKGEILQRWGGQTRKILDPHVQTVQVYRYRCCRCRHTLRYYPAGVDQAQQTQRLGKLAATYWQIGMSLRSAVIALALFGVRRC